MTFDSRRLQANLGVAADGIVGPGTLRAMFQRLGASVDRAGELALSANVHFRDYGLLDTPNRLAHFLAQVCHESGGFKWMEELDSGQAYEGRKDLGNTVPGDGRLFKGRGPIQLTGRANYRSYGQALGVDFMNHPEIVAIPSIGLWVACEYWKRSNLNTLADNDDIEAITRRVNGGLNGYADRRKWLVRVKALLS